MSTVLLKSGSKPLVSRGCLPHHMECTFTLCLSNISAVVQITSQDTGGLSQSHSQSPNMALTDLVSLASLQGGLSTNHPTADSTRPLTGCRPNPPSQSRTPPDECIAPSWFWDPAMTYSEEVKEILLNSRCDATCYTNNANANKANNVFLNGSQSASTFATNTTNCDPHLELECIPLTCCPP